MNTRQGKHLRDVVEVGDLATLPGNQDSLFDADRYSTATRPEQPYPPAYYPASERRVRWVGKVSRTERGVQVDAKHGPHGEYHEERQNGYGWGQVKEAFRLQPSITIHCYLCNGETVHLCSNCAAPVCDLCGELHIRDDCPRPAADFTHQWVGDTLYRIEQCDRQDGHDDDTHIDYLPFSSCFVPKPQVVALDLEIAHTISEALRDMWHRGGMEKEAELAWGLLDAQIAAVEGAGGGQR